MIQKEMYLLPAFIDLLSKAYGKKDISKLYPKVIVIGKGPRAGHRMRVWVRGDKVQVTKELLHQKLYLLAEITRKKHGEIRTFRVDFFKGKGRDRYDAFEIKNGKFYARGKHREYKEISKEVAGKFLREEFKHSSAIGVVTQQWGDKHKKLWVNRREIPQEHINSLHAANKLMNLLHKISERVKHK